MYLRYGSYTHAIGETGITTQRSANFNEASELLSHTERWDIQGMIVADGPAAITTASAALLTAYDAQQGNITLFHPDGTTARSITSSATLGGVHVVSGVQFQDTAPAAYTTYRNFTVSLEWTEPTSGNTSALVSFVESISYSGTGGALIGHIETLRGLPVKQKLRRHTKVSAVQQGRAIGYRAYPVVPSPMWPLQEIVNAREIGRDNPTRFGNTGNFSNFPISWKYQFEAKELSLLGSGTTVPNTWTTV